MGMAHAKRRLVAGVTLTKGNRQNECREEATCTHRSPIILRAKSAVVLPIKPSSARQVALTAGEDETHEIP